MYSKKENLKNIKNTILRKIFTLQEKLSKKEEYFNIVYLYDFASSIALKTIGKGKNKERVVEFKVIIKEKDLLKNPKNSNIDIDKLTVHNPLNDNEDIKSLMYLVVVDNDEKFIDKGGDSEKKD